jgi:hypothetical protein
MATVRVVGIDVGVTALHAVAISGDEPSNDAGGSFETGCDPAALPRVTSVHLAAFDRPESLDGLYLMCAGARGVGIDAPDRRTPGCLLRGAPSGRCAEVALAARRHGGAERISGGPVSMLTPPLGASLPARLEWMQAGFALWSALAAHCPDVMLTETYPSGSFRRLAVRSVPPVKLVTRRTPTAPLQRLGLVADLVEVPLHSAMWSLDGVDALAAALAAYGLAVGHGAVVAEHNHPGHDGSRIALIA